MMCESAPGVFHQDTVTALRFLWNIDKLLEENIFLPKKANVSHVVIPVDWVVSDRSEVHDEPKRVLFVEEDVTPPSPFLILAAVFFFFWPNLSGIGIWPWCQRLGQINLCWSVGVEGWGCNRRCVCPSTPLCACMCTGTNLPWGGSDGISIIRGLRGTPLSAPDWVSPPYPIIPPARAPSTQPPSPSYPSVPLSVSVPPRHPAPIQRLHSPRNTPTTSAYPYPYHYLLHCRHLVQRLGITSPHLEWSAVLRYSAWKFKTSRPPRKNKNKNGPTFPPPECCAARQLSARWAALQIQSAPASKCQYSNKSYNRNRSLDKAGGCIQICLPFHSGSFCLLPLSLCERSASSRGPLRG